MSDSEGSGDSFFMDENDYSENEPQLDQEEENEDSNQFEDSYDEKADSIDEDEDDEDDDDEKKPVKQPKKVLGETKPLTDEAIAEYNAKLKKTGVVYLSSIPPYMTWNYIIKLLSEFGEINRSHLVEEDKSITRRRKRSGGSKKVSFVEGWVEFVDKKDAKTAVAQLNGRAVGGRKNGFFHDYIWTMKYLHGFKWSQLMEMMDYEKRVRQDKLKAEFARSRKEDEKYLENAAKSQRIKKIKEKKEKKEKTEKKDM